MTHSDRLQQHPESVRPGGTHAPTTKAPYVTPCLMKYGAVALITGSKSATSLVDTMGGAAGNMLPSDRRLKRGIVRIGSTAHGLNLYEYDIGGRRERGVIADEVERVMPMAVSVGADGYRRVDYALLGVPRPRRDVELLTRATYAACG
jgi:hypothetical protein